MTPPPRGFPQIEFENRLIRAQSLMAEEGLDALLLTTEPEVRYFTGFLTQFWQSPTRPWFLIVPKSGKPVAVIPEIGAPVMARTWIDDIRSWPAPVPEDDGVTLLAETLRDVGVDGGVDGGRVGVPMGPETLLRMPLADYARLGRALPQAAFVDGSAVIRAVRRIKSDAEIAKIAHICRIASDGFEAVPEIAHEGQPLSETFRAFKIALLGRGADDVSYLVGAAAPGGYDDVISPPSDRPLARGDLLMMDTGALYDGYFCDFDRNYAVGTADDVTRRAYDTLYRATDAAIAAARPGATSRDLFRAQQAVIEAEGYACGNVGRLGHGLGMQLTEWPSHTATDETMLIPGMVITLEPGLAIAPGRGMVHEENLVIREDGPELLSRRAPRELPVIA
jgi:Xaa-Pro aminopeptidase